MTERLYITVDESERRMRLVDLLCNRFPALSKMYLREVVREAACEVNGRHENIGFRVRVNDLVEVDVDLSRQHSMHPQAIPLRILHEDSDVIAVDKPAGMLVHPSHREKNGTLLNALVFHLNRGNAGSAVRPGLIHRLDKDTSGVIVIAKNPRAHRILCRQFQRKTVAKRYVAVVDGTVEASAGTIRGNIGRSAEEKMWQLKEEGKPSETRFRVLERRAGRTLLELEPVTGRTNQLRIHCASLGNPISGDVQRGGTEFPRLCLHAESLKFQHPTTGLMINVSAEIPKEFLGETNTAGSAAASSTSVSQL